MDLKETIKLEVLEDISLDYEFILVDNSVFQEILMSSSYSQTDEGKLAHCHIQQKCIEFWKENLQKYNNCYTIQGVLEELKKGTDYDYKEIIKRKCPPKKSPYLSKLRRTIRDVCKERSRLIRYLEDEGRILKLNEKEQGLYKNLFEKYKKCGDYYGLSEVDFNLLISGAVVAQTREPSAIISNDITGLARTWNFFLKKENISREKFGFFVREDISLFRRLRV